MPAGHVVPRTLAALLTLSGLALLFPSRPLRPSHRLESRTLSAVLDETGFLLEPSGWGLSPSAW